MKNFMSIMILALMSFTMTACVTGTNGEKGVKVVEEMSNSQFADILNYTETGVRVACSQLLQRTEVNEEVLSSVASALRDTAQEEAVTVVGGILSDVANRVLDGLPVSRSAIVAVLRFVEGRVQIGIVQEDGTVAITDRTKAILLAVSTGIEDAVSANDFGMTDPDMSNPAYGDFVYAARSVE